MPKRSIDELLEAMQAVQILKEAVSKHDAAINRLIERLELLERRVTALEARTRP